MMDTMTAKEVMNGKDFDVWRRAIDNALTKGLEFDVTEESFWLSVAKKVEDKYNK